jgi:hypothetical protein
MPAAEFAMIPSRRLNPRHASISSLRRRTTSPPPRPCRRALVLCRVFAESHAPFITAS